MKQLLKVKVILMVLLTLGGCAVQMEKTRRAGRVAILKPSKIERFKELHKTAQPDMLEKMKERNIHNYSIYLKDLGQDRFAAFAYFEYEGNKIKDDILPEENDIQWVGMEEVFYFDGKTDAKIDETKVQRYGMVIGLRPEMVPSYKLLHKYAWPEVLDAIEKGNIRNYSIYLLKLKGEYYLFSYFEYIGDNFNTDMSMVDNDPATIAWIKFTDIACQIPIPTRAEGEWWAVMEEVYHFD